MIFERLFEDIICKYPELVEDKLTFKGRQVRVHGKIIDILFMDRFGQKLIVELKIGPLDRKHIGQVMDYEGEVLSEEDPTARVMLVGNRVPPNLKKSLNHHGIEYRELTVSQLSAFLEEKKDAEYLAKIQEDDQAGNVPVHTEEKEEPERKTKSDGDIDCSIEAFLKIVEDQDLAMRINTLRSAIKSLCGDIFEYARKWHWIMYRVYGRQFCGIDIYKKHFIVFINLPISNFKDAKFDIADLKDEYYVKIKIHPDTNLDTVMNYIKMAYQDMGKLTSESQKSKFKDPGRSNMGKKGMAFDESSLEDLWNSVSSFSPDDKHLKYLRDHLDFCKKLTEKILGLSASIKIKVNARQFSFDDGSGVGPFFDIQLAKEKVIVGPLRLTPVDLSAMGIPFRDITGKTYRLGGLVRVDCFDRNETDLNKAFELAKKSFEVKRKIGPAAFFGDLKK